MTPHHEWSLASAAVDGVLDEEEQTLFEEHLARCADCRLELDHMKAAKSFLAATPRRGLSATLRASLEKRYGRPPLWTRWGATLARPSRWASASMAAAAVLGIALGWWNLLSPRRSAEQAIALEPLLAAHARSTSENVIPAGDYFNSNSSAQLAAYEDSSSR